MSVVRCCCYLNGGECVSQYFMRSQRLGFGNWTDGDTESAMLLWGDREVTKLTGGPFSREDVMRRMAHEISNLKLNHVQYWPIFEIESAAFVGCCGLQPREMDKGIFELGFQLRRSAWGQRYAHEAASLVIELAKSRGMASLYAGHHPENLASQRTLLGLGFEYTHHEFYEPTGQTEPCYNLNLNAE